MHSKVTNLKNKSLYKVNQIENLIDNLKAFKMDLNLQNNKANNQQFIDENNLTIPSTYSSYLINKTRN